MNSPTSIKSAIITGPTGPIGRKLISLLANQGVRLLLVSHAASGRNGALAARFGGNLLTCGLQGLGSIMPQERFDAFFHLGWLGAENRETRNDALKQGKNIRYTLDAVELAARSGCKVFVGAGSQAEYGLLPDDGIVRIDTPVAPVEAYGVAKYSAGRLSARLCGTLGIRHCWGRILSVYGEGDRETTLIMYAINCLLRGEKTKFTPCEQLWDYLYTGDCAKALWAMALAGTDGTAYPLGSGEQRPLKDYLEQIRQAVNPDATMGYGAHPYPQGQVMRMRADMGPLQEDTGFRPETDFQSGIQALLEWKKHS